MRCHSFLMLALFGLTAVGCAKDQDEDGFKGDDDCDDLNAAVNPRADEACDGIDNNCDGNIDEGLILEWYADTDNDTFGDPDTLVSACIQPAGYVTQSGDCDDTDPFTGPGFAELEDLTACMKDADGDGYGAVADEDSPFESGGDCNDESDEYYPLAPEDDCYDENDYNCDGSVGFADEDGDGRPACEDCDDTNDQRPSMWYVDYDSDGFGSAIISQEMCEPPVGEENRWAENTDDCDDLVATVNPDATETCNEVDDDCDSEVDEDVTTVFYSDADGDGFGDPSATVNACEVPTGYAATDDDCDDTEATVNPGAEEVCDDGIDNNCDGEGGECSIDPEASDVVLWGAATGDEAGISVSGGGDLNSDGYDDIVIGAKHESTSATQAGAAYIVYGGADLPEEMTLDAADVFLTGENSADKAGRTVQIVPDVNGDGAADLLIGAPSWDTATKAEVGRMYIHFGGGSSGSLSDADVLVKGQNGANYLSLGMTGGDLNGDGEGDVLVGAPGNDIGGSNRGTIYVMYGPVSAGEVNAGDMSDYITGESNADEVGSVLDMFDHNGDGIDDLIVGAPKSDEGGTGAGSVYIVNGPVTGALSLESADLQYTGESAADKFGTSVSSVGDLNDDGLDDLIAGAPGDDAEGPEAGAAYVIYGGAEAGGAMDDDDIYAVKVTGEDSDDQFGGNVVGDGDIDDDGNGDIMVSATFSGGEAKLGSVYIMYGPFEGSLSAADADVRFEGSTDDDKLGNSLSFAGDVDGDGNTAVLIGAAQKDTTGVDAGGAYLMLDIGL